MAANKFATMLQKNTRKITAVLAYAVLEWILIVFILLNSLFSYCIIKFAKHFGLKPPCSWCSRVDHVLEGTKSYRDHLCDAHAAEVSRLSFCTNHGKLAETHLMCEDCSGSRPNQDDESVGITRVALLTLVSAEIGDEDVVSCSCCEKSLSRKFCQPYLLIKPSWSTLNSAQKGTSVLESIDDEADGSDKSGECEKLSSLEDQDEDLMKTNSTAEKWASPEANLHCDDQEAEEDIKLCENKNTNDNLSIESCDFSTIRSSFAEDLMDHIMCPWKCECDCQKSAGSINSSRNAIQETCSTEEQDRENALDDISEEETNQEEDEDCFDIETGEYENASVLTACNKKHDNIDEENETTDENHTETSVMEETLNPPVNQEENDGAEQSVVSEEPINPPRTKETAPMSLISEIEISDPVKVIEQLKASLEAEKKALNDLYAELEEERSASAIAANETMAMITRLQEEKSAMQMEALQYQRMMEEQAEYDQEALQLLNELMIKREKEKQELEKELETYRQKEMVRMMRSSKDGSVRSKSSEDSEELELSIDLNREARNEDGSFYSGDNTPADVVRDLEEVALDCINNVSILDDSLTEYEEERLAILNQLKVLEEKLLTIADKEFIEDVRAIRRSSTYEVDEVVANCDSDTKQENGLADEDDYQERTTMASMAKSLLPLLEGEVACETQLELESAEMQDYSASKLDLDSDKLAIIEQVDHVYERLQALEEDRDFLKNCIGSIKKGDKGLELLQEILQHLRDLRASELNGGNTTDE